MATFTEDFTRMRNDFDRAHQDRERLGREIHGQVRDAADDVKAMLGRFADEMRDTREGLRRAADRLRSELGQFARDLQTGGGVFRKERPGA